MFFVRFERELLCFRRLCDNFNANMDLTIEDSEFQSWFFVNSYNDMYFMCGERCKTMQIHNYLYCLLRVYKCVDIYINCLVLNFSLSFFCFLWKLSLPYSTDTHDLTCFLCIRLPSERQGSLHQKVGKLCQASLSVRLVSFAYQRIYIFSTSLRT